MESYQRISRWLLVTVVLMGLALPVMAGAKLVLHEEIVGDHEQNVITIWLEGDRLRMEYRAVDDEYVLIFRGDRQVMWLLQPQSKTYVELDQEAMRKMTEHMSQMRDQMMQQMTPQQRAMMQRMMEQMKDLPPEQRKAMEERMRGMTGMGMGPTSPPVYKQVASGEKVKQWTCRRYEVYRDDQKVEDIWVADFETVGLSSADLQVFEQFQEFLQALSRQIGESMQFLVTIPKEESSQPPYRGFPVKSVVYEGAQVESRAELVSVEHPAVPAASFEIPADYTRREFMRMMMEGN
ncbi:MAG: DUF4412 domain-containing protein [Calditrichaeota bacterium]|nr:MAG: DUF4412 domain-containing protein [Calditrichota bacterium]